MAPAVSSTAFKQHISQLLSDLTRCYELCETIRETRRLGSKHEALDSLQKGLKSSAGHLSIEFNSLRKVFGPRMDFGDETSRYQVKSNIREIEVDIEGQLSDIANRRNDGLPGFRDMLRHVRRVEDSITNTLETLAQRLERPTEMKLEKKPDKKPETLKPKKKQDEVVINLKELEKLTYHLKNSWEETFVAGEILYVNCWDQKRNQWERPSGYIKAPPKSTKQTQVPNWDEPPRRRQPLPMDDPWPRSDGW
jgi:hypothetical protein